jgi:alanyl-tRNA synthetase
MPSERLYYTNSYLTQMEARVVAASEDGLRVTLDRTVFYPSSGGQPNDLGTLNGVAIVDAIDEGGAILHVLASPLTETAVRGVVSWQRRYDHMQQHTGQHLLSAVFEELFGIPTLSFRMGEESSTIELGAKELSPEQIDTAILHAAELARANPLIIVTFEDAAQARGLRKATEREGILRIVEIPGIDRSACGGTHVAALAEILPLQIREVEKVRGNARVGFVCGNRAIRRAQSDLRALTRTAQSLGTSLENVEALVVAISQRLAEAEKLRQRFETEAATRAGLDLYAGTSVSSDGIRRRLASEAIIDELARTKAKSFISQPGGVLLMHGADSVLVACSADSGINAGALLKQALTKFGARGGGSPTFAQGNLPDVLLIEDLKRQLGL